MGKDDPKIWEIIVIIISSIVKLFLLDFLTYNYCYYHDPYF